MLGLFGPRSDKIGVYRVTFVRQGPFKKDFSTGTRVTNEVVLRTPVNKGKKRKGQSYLGSGPYTFAEWAYLS
jgi:hypothetical protein